MWEECNVVIKSTDDKNKQTNISKINRSPNDNHFPCHYVTNCVTTQGQQPRINILYLRKDSNLSIPIDNHNHFRITT